MRSDYCIASFCSSIAMGVVPRSKTASHTKGKREKANEQREEEKRADKEGERRRGETEGNEGFNIIWH